MIGIKVILLYTVGSLQMKSILQVIQKNSSKFIQSKRWSVSLSILIFSIVPGATLCAQTIEPESIVRPSIWVKPADRIDIIRKVNTQEWAKSLYFQLGRQAVSVASDDVAIRRKNLETLPFIWVNGKSKTPILPFFRIEGGGSREQQNAIIKSLHDGVDCGVMYFLTQEEKYAKCGADILYTLINSLKGMPISEIKNHNAGWMYPNDHLYESRVIGAQLPIIYDFVHQYLKKGGKVYDVASRSLVVFNFDDAQDVFKTYIDLALNRGLYDSNWPVLESSSLVHNILALDDATEIKKYLAYYTHLDTKNQASLKKVSEKFVNEGDIWPESFGYSRHVASFSVYLMTLLDRYDPNLKLGSKYPNIPLAFKSFYDLQFPNEDYPFMGDGHRSYDVMYTAIEKAYSLAKLNSNNEQLEFFGDFLNASIKSGDYNRGKLKARSFYPSPYYTPTQLLWFENELASTGSVDIARPRPRTKRLDFAGINIQRNISESNPVKDSLMGFIGGGSYIHGHASGIDMELYGQGYVLGVTAGKSIYKTDIHENYYRIFASHNTVISNGASASKGGWIQLGIEPVIQAISEPAVGEMGVSSNYSVTRSTFFDKHNLVTPAKHQRTLALIRLSDTSGYYLDIFKAKNDSSNDPDKNASSQEFHDYIYRNIGESVNILNNGKKVRLKNDKQRYQASTSLPWKVQRKYRHPGWHFFESVKSNNVSLSSFEALFEARNLGKDDIVMKASIPGGFKTQITTVMSPKAHGVPKAYKEKSLPAMVLRRTGDAWNSPFVVAYESQSKGNRYAIQSIDNLIDNGVFKGAKVNVEVDGKALTQYIISQDHLDDTYENKELNITFTGQFAVITVNNQNTLVDMYIGSGKSLSFGDDTLQAKENSDSAYKQF
jgi:hypothetical protein